LANQTPQVPLARDTLERLQTAIVELEAGSGDQIPQRARHKNLAWLRGRHHSVRDVNGNPADLSVGGLDLSGMQTRPDRNTQLGNCRDDRVGGAHRLSSLIKGGKKAVSGGIELSSTEPPELSSNRRVVGRHQPLPRLVTEADGQVG